jgi:hypothetical protein
MYRPFLWQKECLMKGVNLHLDQMIHWSDIKFVLTVLGVFHSPTLMIHACTAYNFAIKISMRCNKLIIYTLFSIVLGMRRQSFYSVLPVFSLENYL